MPTHSASVRGRSGRASLLCRGIAALGCFLFAPAAVAQFSATQWTDDATSGITFETTWAYRFNSTTNTTVNGKTVQALSGLAASAPNAFALTAPNALNVITGDTNSLTSGSGGSAEIGRNFLYGANPATVTLHGLTSGRKYVATFLSVGWDDPPAVRNVTFASDSDSLMVNQSQFGNNQGIRVDYVFTATATTRAITLTPADPGTTWHHYALALRLYTPTGQFSISSWNADLEAGIGAASTWAYRFNSTTNATIEGKTVTGIGGGNPAVAGKFSIDGVVNTYSDDVNNRTLGAGGSAEVAKHFIYGGNPATVTLSGLTLGQPYVATFLSVGFDSPPTERNVTFASEGAALQVNQSGYGNDQGIRVDFAFTATAATRVVTITPAVPGATWHHYALALRPALQVTSVADSGAGTLRQRLADAAVMAGPDFIRFGSTFNGEPADTIILSSAELAVNDFTGRVTIDASNISSGVTVSGNSARRVFNVGAGSTVTMKRLTVTGGRAVSAPAPGNTGAGLLSAGNLTMEDCVIAHNDASELGGGLRVVSGGALVLRRCSLYENTGAPGSALHFAGMFCTLEQCTVSSNTTFNSYRGAIYIESAVTSQLTHCTIARNSGGGLAQLGGQLVLQNTIIAQNLAADGRDVHKTGGSLFSFGANLIGSNESVTGEFPAGWPNAQGNIVGTAAAPVDPGLLALGFRGGSSAALFTMQPMAGSPAINAVPVAWEVAALTTDQRGAGFSRKMWAPSNASQPAVDIGAVEAGVSADAAWEVREIFGAGQISNGLFTAEAWANNPGAATVLTGTRETINLYDPDTNANDEGSFPASEPFACNNQTQSGLANGDDDDFVVCARSFLQIFTAGDYTLGFNTDDGARLRVFNPDGSFLDSVESAGPSPSTGSFRTFHFPAGVYGLEFLYFEHTGHARAEVVAAPGTKTAIDASFRLIGDAQTSQPVPLSHGVVLGTGWQVDVLRNGSAISLPVAVEEIERHWHRPRPVRGLRFTTANDAPERDPATWKLEGTQGTAASGPWSIIASGVTGLSTTRFTPGPVQSFANATVYQAYRLTFPTLRNTTTANAVQVAEVEFLDENGMDIAAPGDGITGTSAASPSLETPAMAIDNRSDTKYLNFDEENSGLVWTPSALNLPAGNATPANLATLNLFDPQNGGLPTAHGETKTPFPGDTPADEEKFALGARAQLQISAAGEYTFCTLADDGVRVRIRGTHGWSVSGTLQGQPATLLDGFQSNGCCAEVFGHVYLTPGTYEIEVIYNEQFGGAYLSLWAAQGRLTTFDASNARFFSLVGANTGAALGVLEPELARQSGLSDVPINDNFANALTLSGRLATASAANYLGTRETGEPSPSLGTSLWWQWTAPSTGWVQVDTAGSNLDTILAVRIGSAVNGLTLVASNDNDGDATTSRLLFQASAGTTYRIHVGGRSGATGLIVLHLEQFAAPANDQFANATVLPSSGATSTTGTSAGATFEGGEPPALPGTAETGQSSVWFEWTAPSSGEYTFDTIGSTFDTVLALYPAIVSNVTRMASNDNFNGAITSLIRCRVTAGATYNLQINGISSSTFGRYVLNIRAIPELFPGALTVEGDGSRTFHFVWTSQAGETYLVQQSTDLQTWGLVDILTAEPGFQTSLDIAGIPAASPKLFIRIQRP
ncbi:MAG: right-handed parallel beta-helix repeat-containing protein [Verrucomicrobiales bacterium]|nr:right-handed parallel beta-helix repeat-containing protein [Verrucomicrobiales bacterium]